MRRINRLKSLFTGETPIFEVNDGKPINELVIRHGDIYFMIDIDAESGDPTGEYGWSRGAPMTPTPIREHHHTVPTYSSKETDLSTAKS